MEPLKPLAGQAGAPPRRAADAPEDGTRTSPEPAAATWKVTQTEVADATPAPGSVDDEAVQLRSAEQNVEELRELARSLRRKLEFRVSDDGRMVIDVRDAETGELIRSVPPEEQRRVIRALEEGDPSLLDSEA